MLANKNDLPEAMGVDEMIGAMGLERVRDRAVSVSVSTFFSFLVPWYCKDISHAVEG